MSKNLNNLSSAFQDELDLDKAWSEMRKTLDQKLPIKEDKRSRRRFFYFYRIAAMFLLFLGALLLGTIYYFNDDRQLIPTSLPPNRITSGNLNGTYSNPTLNNNSVSTGKIVDTTVTAAKIAPGVITTAVKIAVGEYAAEKKEIINIKSLNIKGGDNSNTTLKETGIEQPNKSGQVSQKTLPLKDLLKENEAFSKQFLQNKNGIEKTEKYSTTRQLGKEKNTSKSKRGNRLVLEGDLKYSIIKAEAIFTDSVMAESEKVILQHKNSLILKDTSLNISEAAKNDEQKKKKKLIGFEIGAYYNVGGSLNAIYPIAALTIPVNKKAFLSLGVGLNSQVKINDFAPKEFTVLNDTVNQAYFTVGQKNIRKAVYVDLPVSINYKINNRITVNAGVQLSVLQHVDVDTEEKTFDFQANLSQQVSSSVNTPASSSTPYQVYAQDYTLMKTNWRFIAGIGYQFKNVGIKFQYQQSFTPNYSLTDFNGAKFEKRLSIFTVGLTYRIK